MEPYGVPSRYKTAPGRAALFLPMYIIPLESYRLPMSSSTNASTVYYVNDPLVGRIKKIANHQVTIKNELKCEGGTHMLRPPYGRAGHVGKAYGTSIGK